MDYSVTRTAWRLLLWAAALFWCAGNPAQAAGDLINQSIKGSVTFESRIFLRDPLFPEQRPQHYGPSLSGEIEYVAEFKDRNRVTIKPFYRYDASDNKRTHFDMRELVWLKVWKGAELRVGATKVFWGVTEVRHLVDIINQTDLVENIDGEDKLGQPMIYLSLPRKWGTVDLFYLPYFRERTFPGRRGRLRGQFFVDSDRAVYESSLNQWHPDFAVRYSHSVGELDFGIYYFRGTGREPSFIPGATEGGEQILVPFYQIIDQVGLDAQWTTGPWLLKLEMIFRNGQNNLVGTEEAYVSWVAGFEYTFFSVFGTRADIGVLAEHLYDSRRSRAITPFDNALFVGFRLAFNDPQDTQILAGIIQDLDSPQKQRNYFVEASRRFGSRWTVSAEARFLTGPSPKNIQFFGRRDDFFQLELTYNF